jgi:hypothetical protein
MDALSQASRAAQTSPSELRAHGKDPAHGGAAGLKRGRTIAKRMREAAEFDKEVSEVPSANIFRNEILPALQPVPVRMMAEATGLTRQYCSMVRRGLYVPHPRHWETLREIAKLKQVSPRELGTP